MKNILLKKNDYDIYTLEIPLNVILKGRENIKNWIITSMERRHPLFLQQYEWDYKIFCSKFRFFVKILVIDKTLKLELGSKGLYVKEPHKELYFCNSFVKNHHFLWLFIFPALLAIFLISAHYLSNHPGNPVTQQQNFNEHENQENIYDFEKLINEFSMKTGFIRNISLSQNGNLVNCVLCTEGFFPEELEKILESACISNMAFHNLSYENNTPVCNFEINFPFQKEEISEAEKFSSVASLRNIILEKGQNLIHENRENMELAFTVSKNEWGTIFSDFINKNQFLGIEKIKIDNISETLLEINIRLKPGGIPINQMKLLTWKRLFSEPVDQNINKDNLPVILNNNQEKNELIGKIKSSGGKNILIQKSLNTGRIFMEVSVEK